MATETQSGEKQGRYPQKKFFHRKKFCRFCSDSNIKIDYKNTAILNNFVTERGKIMPRRITGNCAFPSAGTGPGHQTRRQIAIMPYVTADGK